MATIRFRLTDRLKLLAFADGPILKQMPPIESFECPRCGFDIQVIGEVDSTELDRFMLRHCDRILKVAQQLVGEADEFFQEQCGVSYVQSKNAQTLRRLERAVRKCRETLDTEG
jgi:hypothetical protein